MKTSILKTVCVTFAVLLMSGFATKAQEPFYDTEYNEYGRMVSKTKYVMKYSGLYERESVTKCSYDDDGNFLKKEVFLWNEKYVWNDKAGRYIPDYSEKNWTPQYCILNNNDIVNNFIYSELLIWNKSKQTYDTPKETMIIQLNDKNYLNYFAFQSGGKFEVVTNNINYNSELLAKSAK